MTQEYPRLLPDNPSDDDKLGGAHKRIAKALAKLFTSSKGGKSVRVDGEWGAGKSTVVRMLIQELDPPEPTLPRKPEEPEFAVFLYDAWVHSGDPLKQAFFRALLDKLQQRGWLHDATTDSEANADTKSKRGGNPSGAPDKLSREYWNGQLDLLSSRVKRSERKENPKFSANGRYVLALIVTFGAGLPYLSKLLGYFAEEVGSVAVGLVVVVATFALVWRIPESALNYFLLRNSDTKETETRGDFVPTSIDFQNVFGSLMTASMKDPNRRLVIVIDNLDRIAESELRDVWSLLRSFLDNPSFSPHGWFERLWVVIPIANPARLSPSINGKKETSAPVNTFLEKVFQIRFSVPPPMLQSWKTYLREKLQQAFGGEKANEYEDIQRIYDIYLSTQETPEVEEPEKKQPMAGTTRSVAARITPRALIAFVNELVALRLERDDATSLPLLAAYQLAAASPIRDASGLPKVGRYVREVLADDRLDDAWAMIHYCADNLDDASYIVAYPNLDVALRSGSSETVWSIVGRSAGAAHILERYIYEDLADLRGNPLIRAAHALNNAIDNLQTRDDQAANLRSFSIQAKSRFATNLWNALQHSTVLNVGDALIVESIDSLFQILPNRSEAAEYVIKLMSAQHTKLPPTNLEERVKNWDEWINNLESIVQIPSISQTLTSEPDNKLVLVLTEQQFVNMIVRWGGTNLDWILTVIEQPPTIPLKIDEWFSDFLLSSGDDDEHRSALTYYVTRDKSHFSDVFSQVLRKCAPSGHAAQAQLGRPYALHSPKALSFLLNISHEGARELLRPHINDSFLPSFLDFTSRSNGATFSAKWAAIVLWTLDGNLPPLPPPMRGVVMVGNTVKSPEWVNGMHVFFANDRYIDKIDEEDFADFVVTARIFEILDYGSFASVANGKLLLAIARSKALRSYIDAEDGLDPFVSTYLKDENLRQRFIAEFESPRQDEG